MLYTARQSKPWPGIGIDWSNPLTQGLISAWPLNEGGGQPIDAVNQYSGALVGSPTWAAGTTGSEMSFVATSSQYVNAGPNPQLAGASNATLFVVGYRNLTTDLACVFAGITASKTFGALIFSDGHAYYQADNGSLTAYGSAAFNPSASNYSLATVYDGTQATTTNRITGYANGQNLNLSYTNTPPTTLAVTATDPLTIGAQLGGVTRYDTGRIACVYLWLRSLAALEIASLHANPWQIFQPQAGWLFNAAVAGARTYYLWPGENEEVLNVLTY